MKKMSVLFPAVALAAMLLTDGSSRAATIAAYDFSGQPGGANNFGTSPLLPASTLPDTTVGGLTRGPGIGTTGTGAAFAFGGNDYTITSPSAANAAANGDFISLTAQANAGFLLSLSSIDAYNIRRSGTGPSNVLWQYSLDGTTFTDIGAAAAIGAVTTAAGNPQALIDLTGISALQNVAATTTVTLRALLWGASATGGTGYLNSVGTGSANTTDFSISGELVPVPEPATLGLAAMSLVGLLAARRRS
jgi:hypothetical protein